MKVSQISIPSVGAVTPTSSFFNINFILGIIVGGFFAAMIAVILWPKAKELFTTESPLHKERSQMMQKMKGSI